MHATPTDQHRWLEQLLGTWTSTSSASGDPDAPGEVYRGTETVRKLGDLWIVAESDGTMPDMGPSTTLMTLGFDPERERFVGTWIGSMMTFLWTYDGALDPDGRGLSLDSLGPDMTGKGRETRFRDRIEILSPDHRTLTAHVLDASGSWQKLMQVDYHRAD